MDRRLERIDEKMGDVRERLSGLEATQNANWGVTKANRRALEKHSETEGEIFRRLEAESRKTAQDVAFLRGVITEREKTRKRNPLLRVLIFVLGLFGVKLDTK